MLTFVLIGGSAMIALFMILLLGDFFHSDDPESPFFSPQTFLTFLVGFGASGAIFTSFGFTAMEASVGGIAFGVIFGILSIFLISKLQSTQSDSTPMMEDLNGKIASCVDVITPPSFGTVTLNHHGSTRFFRAGSAVGIAPGQLVIIVSVSGADVYVEPYRNRRTL